MRHPYRRIRDMYEAGFQMHGVSPAALLTPKGRQELRFRVLEPIVAGQQLSLLDFGCGLGYLYEYLLEAGHKVAYTGVDIVPAFVESCRMRFGAGPSFHTIDFDTPLSGEYDIVFASGVFNIRTHQGEQESKALAFRRLRELFLASKQALVCDFLSSFVDFQQEDALHFACGEVADFCATHLNRRFVLRHDLLPYEFTVVVYRDAAIRRPENIYEIDAAKAVVDT